MAAVTVLIPDARQEMFRGLIDYAGLFPPASRDIAGAVAGYREARGSAEGWIAGRFLCPAIRLEELAEVLVATMGRGEGPWPIGVVFDTDPVASAAAATAFHSEMAPAATVDLAEVRVPPGFGPDEIFRLFTTAASVTETVVPFLEVPGDDSIPATVGAIATAVSETLRRGGAKLRCGGPSPDDFPSTEEVAGFIVACTEHDLPFKTTAGLHHPIRHYDGNIDVMRHGFVNLLTASVAAREGSDVATIEAIVADTEPDSFELGFAGVVWQGQRMGHNAIGETRSNGLIAYGSCEFDEPVRDLAALGYLP
ncbi:MAG: hypothetical protein BMS9Abin07_1786 [Acidimicrobiia bacterium]|nr:MAG: hypothetical protein BMS9Abin07_1786 [Acidimicrobiia bacterium]